MGNGVSRIIESFRAQPNLTDNFTKTVTLLAGQTLRSIGPKRLFIDSIYRPLKFAHARRHVSTGMLSKWYGATMRHAHLSHT